MEYIHFQDGRLDLASMKMTYGRFIRALRSGQASQIARFDIDGDATLTQTDLNDLRLYFGGGVGTKDAAGVYLQVDPSGVTLYVNAGVLDEGVSGLQLYIEGIQLDGSVMEKFNEANDGWEVKAAHLGSSRSVVLLYRTKAGAEEPKVDADGNARNDVQLAKFGYTVKGPNVQFVSRPGFVSRIVEKTGATTFAEIPFRVRPREAA